MCETGYKGEQQKAIFIVSAVDFVELTVKRYSGKH